jgi:hypothetical protein
MGGSIGIAENEGVPAPNPLLLPFAPRPGDRVSLERLAPALL